MQAVLDAIEEISPGYELTPAQQIELERNQNPEQTAEWLPGRIDSMAQSLAKDAPRDFDWRIVPKDWLLQAVDFERPLRKKSTDFWGMSKQIGLEETFILGYLANQKTVVETLYAEILGREPDAAGKAHYNNQLAGGRARWEIVREIELSEEAQANG